MELEEHDVCLQEVDYIYDQGLASTSWPVVRNRSEQDRYLPTSPHFTAAVLKDHIAKYLQDHHSKFLTRRYKTVSYTSTLALLNTFGNV